MPLGGVGNSLNSVGLIPDESDGIFRRLSIILSIDSAGWSSTGWSQQTNRLVRKHQKDPRLLARRLGAN